MQIRNIVILLFAAALLAGCQADKSSLVSAGLTAMKGATLTDAEVKSMATQSCAQMDSQSTLAPANSKYTKRLNTIAKALGASVDGQSLDYKVYTTDEVNAWAMPNGCIRVYTGLMDLMTDNEIEGVLGHEIGHVALGHSKAQFQLAYATMAARQAAAASGSSTAATLSRSELGDLAEAVVHAQYSQSDESQADDYSFDLLKKRGIAREGLITAFEKLAQLSGDSSGGGMLSNMLSSHPQSKARAEHIRKRLAKEE